MVFLKVNNVNGIRILRTFKGFFLISFILLFISCKKETKYVVLNTIFDGVPNPDKIEVKGDSAKNLAIVDSVSAIHKIVQDKVFYHTPYNERNCSACHQSSFSNKLNEPLPGLCYQCHDDFKSKFSYLHGPVENGQCVLCHEPHSSMNEKLLLKKGTEICFQCHTKEDVMKNQVHEGIEGTSCMECHNPHGGTDRFILK